MNKEDRIRDSKKIYDATEIPSELSETVHQAIYSNGMENE